MIKRTCSVQTGFLMGSADVVPAQDPVIESDSAPLATQSVVEDVEHIDPPAVIDPEEACSVVCEQWAGSVERLMGTDVEHPTSGALAIAATASNGSSGAATDGATILSAAGAHC